MTNDVKIRSSFLSCLNEALQKLTLNDKIQGHSPVIVEADGKFTSVLKANNNFDPSVLGKDIDVDSDNNEKEKSEDKDALLAKATEAIKTSIEASGDLKDILAKIKKLSEDDEDFNVWVVNKEGNTANLKSKKASIFKQNNNLCLSHDGKVEIFKSVNELRNWLKDNKYPLPENISIHESVEKKRTIKEAEGRNWLDLLKNTTNLSQDIEQNDKEQINTAEIDEYLSDLEELNEVKRKYKDKIVTEKQKDTYDKRMDYLATVIGTGRHPKEDRPLSKYEYEMFLKTKNIIEEDLNEIYKKLSSDEYKTIEKVAKELDYKFNKKWSSERLKNILADLESKHNQELQAAKEVHRSNNPFDTYKLKGLGTPEYKKFMKYVSTKDEPFAIKDLSVDNEEEPVEECIGCTATSGLGTAVSYLGNKKEEDVLNERTEHYPENLFADGTGVKYDTNGHRDKGKEADSFIRNLAKGKEPSYEITPELFNELAERCEHNNISREGSPKLNKIMLKFLSDYINNNRTNFPEIDDTMDINKYINNIVKTHIARTLPYETLKNFYSKISEEGYMNLLDILNKVLNKEGFEEKLNYDPNLSKFENLENISNKFKEIYGHRILNAVNSAKTVMNVYWENPYWKSKQDEYLNQKQKELDKPSEIIAEPEKPLTQKVKEPDFTPEELTILQKHGFDPENKKLAKELLRVLSRIRQESKLNIFEAATDYPWLNKVLNTRLVEDDTPADFAKGSPIDSKATEAPAVDSTTATNDMSTGADDIDLNVDDSLGGEDVGGNDFGNLSMDINNYGPDGGEEEMSAPAVDLPEYRIIDLLMNDKDPNNLKVKVKNEDTNEIEEKDIWEIDV